MRILEGKTPPPARQEIRHRHWEQSQRIPGMGRTQRGQFLQITLAELWLRGAYEQGVFIPLLLVIRRPQRPHAVNPDACSQGLSLGHKPSFLQTDRRSPLPPRTKTRQTKKATTHRGGKKKKKEFFLQYGINKGCWPAPSSPWYLHLLEHSSPAFPTPFCPHGALKDNCSALERKVKAAVLCLKSGCITEGQNKQLADSWTDN